MDILKLENLKLLQTKFKDLGNTTSDMKLKTKYLVIASNMTALINQLESNKSGRYE